MGTAEKPEFPVSLRHTQSTCVLFWTPKVIQSLETESIESEMSQKVLKQCIISFPLIMCLPRIIKSYLKFTLMKLNNHTKKRHTHTTTYEKHI